jgi:hypothetical protein
MAFLGGGGHKPAGGTRPETPKIPGPSQSRGQPSPYSDTPRGGPKTCPHCGKDITAPAGIENNPAIIQHYLDTLEDISHKLSDWERNFFKGLKEQFENRGSLSDKQVATLSRIYADKS